jgi:hypothetical protein
VDEYVIRRQAQAILETHCRRRSGNDMNFASLLEHRKSILAVVRQRVAPAIANHAGARRAGQGRDSGEPGERTLDTPKRSRKIETGATARHTSMRHRGARATVVMNEHFYRRVAATSMKPRATSTCSSSSRRCRTPIKPTRISASRPSSTGCSH